MKENDNWYMPPIDIQRMRACIQAFEDFSNGMTIDAAALVAPASSPWSEAALQSVDLRMTAQIHPGHTARHVDAAAIPG